MIATITLARGKVNALNEPLVEELHVTLKDLEDDRTVRSIVLTGRGNFFSFGFDIPEFLSYDKASFARYLKKFTSLYTDLFIFPKPVVAALNGHAIAGGCMLAIACDYRLMVSGKAKISLNEISFASSVPAGSVEMLTYATGERNAGAVLLGGAMYAAEDALRLGLIDRVTDPEHLNEEARGTAGDFAEMDPVAFKSLKGLLRRPVAEKMVQREEASIREFVEIWYSESTRNRLKDIKIY